MCLNDGTYTRVDVARGSESAIDITIASQALAGRCNWEVLKESTVGSDHYPVVVQLEIELVREQGVRKGRWVLEKAEWETFAEISESGLLGIRDSAGVDCMCQAVTSSIISAAELTIPKSKHGRRGKVVPWWSEACSGAVRDRNKAFRVLKQTLSFGNLRRYKQCQAVLRRTVKSAKRESWKKFCESIERTTPIQRVWGVIKKMRGNGREFDYPVMVEDERPITNSKDKAEAIAKALVKVHSSGNLTHEERIGREMTMEKYREVLSEEVGEGEVLNTLFTLNELKNVLKKAGKSSPGRDTICYIMLDNLTDKGKEVVLRLFNKVWLEGDIPAAWKQSVIIPIRKPGKDAKNPSNYRPIALTSQIGKVMERMVNDRLVYWLETGGLLHSYQSGFRKGRGTMDPVVALEDSIRKAQVNKETVLAIFFDVEKAYDMVWKEGLLIKLRQLGITGRIFQWIRDFLTGRRITVKINEAFSNEYLVENGTPQGSIISPVLFLVLINEVFIGLDRSIKVALFADDGAMWKSGRNVNFVVNKMQQAVDDVQKWALEWGLRISVEKTKTVFFTRRKIPQELKLNISGAELERVECFKYLGLWFDKRLSWSVHIQKMVEKCKKVLNVMRCLRGVDWGANRPAMRTVYIRLIRSVFDYGCVAYRSAAKSLLVTLDVIQHKALRLCCGAMKTTPVNAIQVQMGEMPLHIRRDQLTLVYWANLRGHKEDHISRPSLLQCQERGKSQGRNFGWIIDQKY